MKLRKLKAQDSPVKWRVHFEGEIHLQLREAALVSPVDRQTGPVQWPGPVWDLQPRVFPSDWLPMWSPAHRPPTLGHRKWTSATYIAQWHLIVVALFMLRYAAFRLRSELGCKHDLEGDADIPPILEGYFMNFWVGIHKDGNLKTTTTTHRHNSQSTTTDGSSVETRASLHSETYAWGWNVHTALQLFAMRLAVFLKVFSR